MSRTPEGIDKAEDKRVEQLRSAARQRPSLHISNAKRRSSRAYVPPMRILGYSNSAALGDAIRKKILDREFAMAYRADGLVVHVCDGKPLTAHGAALLGVPWDGEKEN